MSKYNPGLICAAMVALMLAVASPSVAEPGNEIEPSSAVGSPSKDENSAETVPGLAMPDAKDTAYLWPWQKEFLVILSVNARAHMLEFKDLDDDKRKLVLRPNNGALFKPQFIQGPLSFAVESTGFGESEVKPAKGDTDFLYLEVSQRWRSLKMDYYFESYRGFYVEDQQRADGSYFVFPEMETRRYGISATYYRSDYPFRNKLYYAGPWTSHEPPPKRRGATALYTLLLDSYSMRNLPRDPATLSQIQNGDLINFERAEFYTLSAKAGGILYHYGPSGYAEVGLTLGAGAFRQKFSDGGPDEITTETAFATSIYADMGLRKGRWLTGLILRNDMVNPSFRTTRFSFQSTLVSLYVGRRFD